MSSRKIWSLGKGSLPCRLLGAIDIRDEPVLALTVSESTRWKGLNRLGDEVILKEHAKCLNTRLIQGGQKARERGTMREPLAIEEGHEGDRKRGESVIKGEQGWLCTDGISEKHHHKIKHLIRAEARTGEPDLVFESGEQTRGREAVGHNGHREQTSKEVRERSREHSGCERKRVSYCLYSPS